MIEYRKLGLTSGFSHPVVIPEKKFSYQIEQLDSEETSLFYKISVFARSPVEARNRLQSILDESDCSSYIITHLSE